MSDFSAGPRQSESLIFYYDFIVQEVHLDTFGHMNHATYLQVFEQARWEFITNRGYGIKEIQKLQVGPTVLGLQILYRRELRLGEKVQIESVFPEFKGKIGKAYQKMINENGKVAASIELTIGLFDMKERKLVNATPEWLNALGIQSD